jgi:hypothetical protein
LRRSLTAGEATLVRSGEERTRIKATALSWFQSVRQHLGGLGNSPAVSEIDTEFKRILEMTEREGPRSKYLADLKGLHGRLIRLRSDVMVAPSSGTSVSEVPPDFSRLIADARMQAILVRRWQETLVCMRHDAHLAATVMMGGLLEALLLARINRMPTLAPAFQAKTAPRDKAGKTYALKEWTLQHYIDVAHELGWIGQSAKDIGVVLRDWRNYVHPAKEFSHGVVIEGRDTTVFWSVFTSIAAQVIASA